MKAFMEFSYREQWGKSRKKWNGNEMRVLLRGRRKAGYRLSALNGYISDSEVLCRHYGEANTAYESHRMNPSFVIPEADWASAMILLHTAYVVIVLR